jgi:hypothetical protein
MGPRHFMRRPSRYDEVFVLVCLQVFSSNGGVTQFALCVPNLQQDYMYHEKKRDENNQVFAFH